MNPVVDEVWKLASEPAWNPDTQLANARAIWNSHQYKATWSAFAVSLFTVQQMAGGTTEQPVAVSPEAPPEAVLAVLGDRTRAINAAHATWNVIAGVVTAEYVGLDDPFLEDQLKAVSREFKGTAVYLYAWWTATARARIAEDRPDTIESEIAELKAQIGQLGRSE